MRKLALLALVVPGLAFSQVSVSAGVRIDLPIVLPQLVVVSPGVQVVPEMDYEVFYVNGWYWVRDDGRWYRSRNHRGGWVAAPMRVVPASLVRIPPGHYKHWKPGKGEGHGKWDDHGDRGDHYDRDDRGGPGGGHGHGNGGGHGGGKHKH